ncbi:MAG: PAS domain-containing protein [Pseudomonadota bacterium]
MPTISDPTKLDKEELIAEWAVREEELRLQFESLKSAQTQAQLLLQRYERIFSFCPLPLLVIDNRAEVKEINNAARQLLGRALASRSNLLLNTLTEGARLSFTQAMRSFMNEGAAKAQQLPLEFRDVEGRHDTLLVSLDTREPPDTFVVILTPERLETI